MATGIMISTWADPPSSVVPDSRVTFATGASGSSVTLSGGTSTFGNLAGGLVSGAVTFANSSGTTVACSSSSGTLPWFLSNFY
jgi:hypothetical protein